MGFCSHLVSIAVAVSLVFIACSFPLDNRANERRTARTPARFWNSQTNVRDNTDAFVYGIDKEQRGPMLEKPASNGEGSFDLNTMVSRLNVYHSKDLPGNYTLFAQQGLNSTQFPNYCPLNISHAFFERSGNPVTKSVLLPHNTMIEDGAICNDGNDGPFLEVFESRTADKNLPNGLVETLRSSAYASSLLSVLKSIFSSGTGNFFLGFEADTRLCGKRSFPRGTVACFFVVNKTTEIPGFGTVSAGDKKLVLVPYFKDGKRDVQCLYSAPLLPRFEITRQAKAAPVIADHADGAGKERVVENLESSPLLSLPITDLENGAAVVTSINTDGTLTSITNFINGTRIVSTVVSLEDGRIVKSMTNRNGATTFSVIQPNQNGTITTTTTLPDGSTSSKLSFQNVNFASGSKSVTMTNANGAITNVTMFTNGTRTVATSMTRNDGAMVVDTSTIKPDGTVSLSETATNRDGMVTTTSSDLVSKISPALDKQGAVHEDGMESSTETDEPAHEFTESEDSRSSADPMSSEDPQTPSGDFPSPLNTLMPSNEPIVSSEPFASGEPIASGGPIASVQPNPVTEFSLPSGPSVATEFSPASEPSPASEFSPTNEPSSVGEPSPVSEPWPLGGHTFPTEIFSLDEAPTNADSVLGSVPEDDDGSSCFPGSATVELSDGSIISMQDLRVGHVVKVSPTSISPVFMFTHKFEHTAHEFIRISTASGHILHLSPGHYLYLPKKGLSQASFVTIGTELMLGTGECTEVTSLARVWLRGLYNPQTVSGDIVVSGIRVSTYTTSVEPYVAHTLLTPFRALYNGLGVTTAMFDNGGGRFSQLAPKGKALY